MDNNDNDDTSSRGDKRMDDGDDEDTSSRGETDEAEETGDEENEETTGDEENGKEVVVLKTRPKRKENASNQRNTWARLKDTRFVDGQQVVVYPWLEDDNQKDQAFIGLLALYRPYKVEYGKKNESWKTLEEQIAKSVDLFGNLCFPKSPCLRSLRLRFKDYMTFAKNFNRDVPLRSGCDDEIEYSLLDQLIELHSDYESCLALIDNAKINKSKQQKESAAAASEMRYAAIGLLRKKNSEDSDQTPEDTDETTKPRSAKKRGNAFSSMTDFAESMAARESRLRMKEETKSESVKMKKDAIEFKKKLANFLIESQTGELILVQLFNQRHANILCNRMYPLT